MHVFIFYAVSTFRFHSSLFISFTEGMGLGNGYDLVTHQLIVFESDFAVKTVQSNNLTERFVQQYSQNKFEMFTSNIPSAEISVAENSANAAVSIVNSNVTNLTGKKRKSSDEDTDKDVIRRRTPKLSINDKVKIIYYHNNEQKSFREITNIFRCSKSTVSGIMKNQEAILEKAGKLSKYNVLKVAF